MRCTPIRDSNATLCAAAPRTDVAAGSFYVPINCYKHCEMHGYSFMGDLSSAAVHESLLLSVHPSMFNHFVYPGGQAQASCGMPGKDSANAEDLLHH